MTPVERAALLSDDPEYVRLEGLHCVKHALRFGAVVELVLTTDRDRALRLSQMLAPDVSERLADGLVEVRPGFVPALSGPRRHDVIGFARRPPAVIHTPGPAPAVLLDDPRNLGNLGAAVRVAAGFGARAVRTTGSVDPWHPTVVRASAGLHFAITVERVALEDTVRPVDGRLIALDPSGEDLRGVALDDDAVLAFGSERRGLSPALRRRADRVVAIPMRDRVSSYNLATSVAVALYHWSATGGGGHVADA